MVRWSPRLGSQGRGKELGAMTWQILVARALGAGGRARGGRPGGGRRVGDSASWPAGRLFLFDPDVSVSGS